jgi:hypothetical protein
MLFFNKVAFSPTYQQPEKYLFKGVPSVSVKKPVVKAKEKTSSGANTVGATKRKPSAEVKKSTQVMDARSNKDRRQDDRRQKDAIVKEERRSTERRVKVNRRRQIDPTTCERDYLPEELEFMSALDEYKRRNGRMFPTCSEVLEVVKALGYEKRAESPTAAPLAAPGTVSTLTNEQAV